MLPVLTVGSFFPVIYYGFYCEPFYQTIYLSAISLAGAGEPLFLIVSNVMFLKSVVPVGQEHHISC